MLFRHACGLTAMTSVSPPPTHPHTHPTPPHPPTHTHTGKHQRAASIQPVWAMHASCSYGYGSKLSARCSSARCLSNPGTMGCARRIHRRCSLRQLKRRTARNRGVALRMQCDRMWGVQLVAPVGQQLCRVPPMWYGSCAGAEAAVGTVGPRKNC